MHANEDINEDKMKEKTRKFKANLVLGAYILLHMHEIDV